jgi:hypothetical protein
LASRGTRRGFGRRGHHGISALLGCLAIVIQCLVAQTHIHHDEFISASAPIVAFDAAHVFAAPFDHQHPANTPPHSHRTAGSCFLCQSALAGSGVLPLSPVLVLADLREVDNPTTTLTAPLTGALVSHHWQGRAPPTLPVLV